jgi:penicillin-binding protein 1A
MKPKLNSMQSATATRKALLLLAPLSIGIAAICSVPSLQGLVSSSGLWMPPVLEETSKGVVVYDHKDRYICTVYKDKDKEPVPLNKVSRSMLDAILAAEDNNFYKHPGVDPFAIVRAISRNVQAGKVVEGASTITQQLARNLYLDPADRSLNRKVYEAYLAMQIESRYPKERILELYLNEVYFGRGAYGIERAASNYFNKRASQLTTAESAFLAGIVRSPSLLANPDNKAEAIARRNNVLDQMVSRQMLTSAAGQRAKQAPLAFSYGPHRLRYPHYIQHVVSILKKELGDDIWKRGYKVYTNLDPALQKCAERTLHTGLKSRAQGIDQGALVTMRLKDGAVLAMVGGLGSYDKNQWNRAVYPHTAGSSFKPFVYLSGLLNGVINQDSLIADTPLVIKNPGSRDYTPKNFDGGFSGWMTAREALARSRNICALRVALATGLGNVINTARDAGINSQLDAYPSLALGSCAVSPLDMTEAYGTIARAGEHLPASFIRKIITKDGVSVRTYANAPSRTFPQEETAQLIDGLEDVVNSGTGARAKLPGIPTAGKTGTADKGKDIWFIGFTPEYVTTVWGGSDKNRAVKGNNVTGGQIMAGVWKSFMTGLYSMHKPDKKLAFVQPSRPLLKSIPLYDDDDLLGYSSIDVTNGALMANRYDVKPIGHAYSINVDGEVSVDGIASSISVQKAAATKRQQIAELQKYQEYRAALENMTPGSVPIPVPGSVQAPTAPSPQPDLSTETQALAQRTMQVASQPAQAAPLAEAPHINDRIKDPSADIVKKDDDKDDKKDKDSEESESEEVTLNLNQYRRHPMKTLPAPLRSHPTLQEPDFNISAGYNHRNNPTVPSPFEELAHSRRGFSQPSGVLP